MPEGTPGFVKIAPPSNTGGSAGTPSIAPAPISSAPVFIKPLPEATKPPAPPPIPPTPATFQRQGIDLSQREKEIAAPPKQPQPAPAPRNLPTATLLANELKLTSQQAKEYLAAFKDDPRGSRFNGLPDDVQAWLLDKSNWNQNELALWTSQLESGAHTPPKTSEKQLSYPKAPENKESKPNVPKVITLTSSNDKYVVEVNGERRYMTSAEIEKAGGTVTDDQKQANVLNQISQSGNAIARELKEKEFSIDNAAKKLAADQDMSLKDARDTIKRFMDNPTGREFTHASPETISALLKITPLSVAQYEQFQSALSNYYARSVVQVGINKAPNVKNPNPEYISKADAKQIQKTDLNGWDILKKSGLDAYNAYQKGESKFQVAFAVKDAVKDLPATDQKDLISIYNRNGADAFNKALDKYINDYNARVEVANKEAEKQIFISESEALNLAHAGDAQIKALNDLAKAGYANKDGTYNIAQYLNDNKSSEDKYQTAVDTLKKAGWTDQDIYYIRHGGEKITQGTMPNWYGRQAFKLEKWQDEIMKGGQENIKSARNIPERLLNSAMVGIGSTMAGLVTSIPILALRAIEKPLQAPTLVGTTLKGMAGFIGSTVFNTLSGRYIVDAVKSGGDIYAPVYDGLNTWMMAEGLGKGAGWAIRNAQFVYLSSLDNYVPLRSLSMEAGTARVPFTEKQLETMKAAGATEADIIKAGTEITKQLVAGKKVASVELGITTVGGQKISPITVDVKNVPYQRIVGLSLFNSTPDISLVDRGGSVPIFREFYTAGKAAIEPMGRSYLTGQKATKPGIIEIRISDPELIGKIAPQKRLISGGKTLEPEAPIPSLNQLKGMGYRLEPIPGKAGRGVTFDAALGKIEIRRFTLSKVTDTPAGLMRVATGQIGDGGTVAVGDLHGTTNFRKVYDDINSSFDHPIIKGDPAKPATWHWAGSKQSVVILGDSIDRGPAYNFWRDTFNRLHDEAVKTGGKVERLIGNHELAYLSNDAIKGIKYTDKVRKVIKQAIKDDIKAGRVRAATSIDGKLYTHAGVSTGVFKEYRGKTANYIADDLNKKFNSAVSKNDYNDKMFAKGRTEKGNSLLKNEKSQGGIFWLRPQEAKAVELNLKFPQVVGHNPGFAVRRIWNENFIETDVGRLKGGVGVYADTPAIKTVPADIVTEAIPGKAPRLSSLTMANLRLVAMRDTVADVFLGWNGRIQAIEKMKSNKIAMDIALNSLREQITERKAAGDSIGVKYLKRQMNELTSPGKGDYLYGGMSFWRDIVMGRQNSVSIMDGYAVMNESGLRTATTAINQVRNRINEMSNSDVSRLFGHSKEYIAARLNTSAIDRSNINTYRRGIADKARNLTDIVDEGLERNIAQYLDQERVISEYNNHLASRYSLINEGYNYERGPVRTPKESSRATPRETLPREPARIPPRTPPIRPPGTPPTRPPIRPPGTPPTRPPIRPPGTPPPVIPLGKLPSGGKAPAWTPEEAKSAVGFVMGQLKTKSGLEPMIIARKAPYRDTDVRFFIGETPKGMRVAKDQASAYKTIQLLSGKSPVEFTGKQGFARYSVRLPTPKPGRPGAIAFGTKRIPDQTKRILARLSGGNSLKNLSRRGKGIFKTPVRNGRLLSRQRIVGY